MDLKEHYKTMWENALGRFQEHDFELDNLLGSGFDNRFGITLVARPTEEVKNKIQFFQRQIAQIEPNQYFYPLLDLHITILTIISCHVGFNLAPVAQEKYINLVKSAVENVKSFTINFKGITASPSCIMLQGYPETNTLSQIREDIRTAFRQSDLQHSIDKRYVLQTSHNTVIRFKKPLSDPDILIEKLNEFREYDFGTSEICELELVYNNWYHSQEQVNLLQKFILK